ncbi:MAG: ThiF family adenylyltransferase, partial [Ignavibacteriales bacterium]|nr:ThiF family adenylyltransferase [Ignavibacteriales bacterium]
MKYSIALTEEANDLLESHLIRDDFQEDLCFALYNPSTGHIRKTAIVNQVILPEDNDRNIHGNASFNTQYIERVIDIALEKKLGIVFIHSHPFEGWQDMSNDDINTESIIAPSVFAATNLPLVGMTIGLDGYWSGRFWTNQNASCFERQWCESVRVMGESFNIYYNDEILPKPEYGEEFVRTLSSWGEVKQDEISRLRIGIIGLGSVGAIVAESLIRTGVKNINLIDFDKIEKKNLDRLLYTTKDDIGKAKVEFYKDKLIASSILSSDIQAFQYSIVEEIGFKAALDCDILFSCVDRPWPRFVLDNISYSHFIPVIDGGIGAKSNSSMSNLGEARWRTQVVCPGRICMHCMGQYTIEDVSMEQAGIFEQPTYIKNLPKNHFMNRGENVFAFSIGLAAMELNQMLSYVLRPNDIYIGVREYDFLTSTVDDDFEFKCSDDCSIIENLGIGDSINNILITEHEMA